MTLASTKHNCKEELNDASLRATPARIAVMRLLEDTEAPVDVHVIKDYLSNKHINADPATIFRMMNSFTQKGITRQVSFNEGKFRYELANRPDHHHLVCTSCGKVEPFSECAIPALEEDIKKKKKFLVKSHALEFFGICSDCQS